MASVDASREPVRRLLETDGKVDDAAWQRLRQLGSGTLLPLLAEELPAQHLDGPDLWDQIDWQVDHVLPRLLLEADVPLVCQHLLGHRTPFSRRAGCRLLSRLGPGPHSLTAVNALAERLLHDEHHYVRLAAAEALLAFGGAVKPVLPALRQARDDTNSLVREATARVLAGDSSPGRGTGTMEGG